MHYNGLSCSSRILLVRVERRQPLAAHDWLIGWFAGVLIGSDPCTYVPGWFDCISSGWFSIDCWLSGLAITVAGVPFVVSIVLTSERWCNIRKECFYICLSHSWIYPYFDNRHHLPSDRPVFLQPVSCPTPTPLPPPPVVNFECFKTLL